MKTKLQPPTYFLASVVLLIGLHFTIPLMRLIILPYRYLGGLLIIFGVFLNLWADSLFKKHATTVKPYETPMYLAVSGPFRITRHPMYLGMVSILLGLAVALGSLVSMIVPILFLMVTEVMFIPYEEKSLEQIFKKEYLDYKKKVRRWI
jgi:protein-S-isoprenylcysteine O-methyltransferase Ste14